MTSVGDTLPNPSQKDPVIVIENLSYRYGSGESSFLALQDINLLIREGEFVAITGPSGSGKTTLMNLLGTLATPEGKSLQLAGSYLGELSPDAVAMLRNSSIGFIFQHFNLLPRLTVLENVMLATSYAQPPLNKGQQADVTKRALELLHLLGIEHQAHKLPQALSGGQKQRAAIARALLLEPKIILADEPTGALDSKTSREVLQILTDLNQHGHTVIMITHDPAVTAYAHRRVELRDGKIVTDIKQPGFDGQVISSELNNSKVSVAPAPSNLLEYWWSRTLTPLRDAWLALISAKLRTALTSLGLVIGISSIIIMITLGTEAQNIILKIFNQAGADRIYLGLDYREVRTGKFAGYWEGLDVNNDLPAFQAAFQRYGRIVPLGKSLQEKVYAAGTQYDTRLQPIYGTKDFIDEGLKLQSGRLISPYELEQGSRVTVVGADFTEALFPQNYAGRISNQHFPLGERIAIRGKINTVLTIIGTLKKRETTFESKEANTYIYLPLNTLNRYSGEKKTTWFAVSPNEGVSHRWIADSTKNYLAMRTGMKYPFVAHVPEEVISKIMLFIKVFQALTALIGGLCILVGGIGIMNIMLVTITERVREIGLRKALGARPSDISKQFITECVMLCLFSGVVGSAIGFLFCNLVGFVGHSFLPETVPAQLVFNLLALILGLGTAVLSGLTFGMMPAMKASRMDPSEALRSEA